MNIYNTSPYQATSKQRAFTLIELLVVIAIIALLTGIVMTSLTGSKAKARDAKRVSDLGQIQLALELYYDRCKQYPDSLVVTADNCDAVGGVTLASYITQIPKTPEGGDYEYTVKPVEFNTYVLHAELEASNSSVLQDSLPWTQTPTYVSSFNCYHEGTELTYTDYCIGSTAGEDMQEGTPPEREEGGEVRAPR